MFDRFAVVGSTSPIGLRGGTLAIGVHAAILGFGLHSSHGRADPSRTYVAPESMWVLTQPPRQGAPGAAPTISLPALPTFNLPDVPPIPVIPGGTIEPGPMAIPAGPMGGVPTGDANGVYVPDLVQQVPELLSSPPLRYPALLRLAHIEGTVIVQGVVDTLGRIERTTLRVISSPHPALSTSAVDCLAGAVFRPGRVDGRAVRVLVQLPVQFTISKH
jgi:TonB family protein